MAERIKPLGHKAYGHIPHLPGSRMGLGDHKASEGHNRFCQGPITKNDFINQIIVEVKTDGSCISIARKKGHIISLSRAGYLATTSPFEQHHLFAKWVDKNPSRFEFLKEGERLIGEWLVQAHGTLYDLPHEPFIAFDIMVEHSRTLVEERNERLKPYDFVLPYQLTNNGPQKIEDILPLLEIPHHGELDKVEGAIWRVERVLRNKKNKKEVIICKFVRPDKVDGKYIWGQDKQKIEETWNTWNGKSCYQLLKNY